MSFRVRPPNRHPALRSYGRPSPEKKQGEGSEGNAVVTRDQTWSTPRPVRRAAGTRRGPFLRRRGPPPGPLRAGNMAAPMAAPGRALLRVGAERLLPGGVRALLRPRLGGGTPGPERDFSLSHSRVRARSALRGP